MFRKLLATVFAITLAVHCVAQPTLIGVSVFGGRQFGTIFNYTAGSTTLNHIYDLDGVTGGHPNGSLFLASNGKFYGMTRDGGSHDRFGAGIGIFFEYDANSNSFTKL